MRHVTLLAVFLGLIVIGSLQASISWTGEKSQQWSVRLAAQQIFITHCLTNIVMKDAENWSGLTIPTPSDEVTIGPFTANTTVQLDGNAVSSWRFYRYFLLSFSTL